MVLRKRLQEKSSVQRSSLCGIHRKWNIWCRVPKIILFQSPIFLQSKWSKTWCTVLYIFGLVTLIIWRVRWSIIKSYWLEWIGRLQYISFCFLKYKSEEKRPITASLFSWFCVLIFCSFHVWRDTRKQLCSVGRRWPRKKKKKANSVQTLPVWDRDFQRF